MPFIMPMEIRKGDKIVLKDEDGVSAELVTNAPQLMGDKVWVYTTNQLVQCDPNVKVKVSVVRGPLIVVEVEHREGE